MRIAEGRRILGSSRQQSEETMAPSVVSVFLIVGAASFRCQSHGLVGAADSPLASFPGYCSKNMSRNAIPSLAESVTSTFGGSVSADDVQLLQVCCCQLSFGSRAVVRTRGVGGWRSSERMQPFAFLHTDCCVPGIINSSFLLFGFCS